MKQPFEITTPLPVQISTAYISHGGGPLPLLEMQTNGEANSPQYHEEMIGALKMLSADLPRPDVIIVISAHWEETEVSVTTHSEPSLVYDYYGFSQEAYSLKYPAKGEVSLATLLLKRLTEQGIAVREDRARGFDHGMFIPLSIMYPNADVPCIQVSITSCLNTEKHVLLGEAIRKAVERGIRPVNSDATDQVNILVLGSGSSFHNMHGFFDSSDDAMRKATRFNNWLQTTMQTSAYSENERKTRLVEWYSAPDARYAHPREEHLLPLHVCYGVNNRAADKAMSLTLLTKPASMFVWSD